jgi:hypothetical protein
VGLKKAKNVTIRINGKGVSFELDISEDDVVVNMITSLDPFIKEGFPIRIIQTYTQALSKSSSSFSRVLTCSEELSTLADDTRTRLPIQRGRL